MSEEVSNFMGLRAQYVRPVSKRELGGKVSEKWLAEAENALYFIESDAKGARRAISAGHPDAAVLFTRLLVHSLRRHRIAMRVLAEGF